MTNKRRRSYLRSAALVGTLALALSACGSGDDSGSDSTTSSDGGTSATASGELTIWAWDNTIEPAAEAYMDLNPDVKIEVVNAGTGNDQYTALQNAIAAGSGVPDIAQIEFYALPQFAIGESLADLAPLGASDLDGTFSPGPWNSVQQGNGIYGLPIDSGPMALFYNERIFNEVGVAVPTTWDEYLEAARALKAAGYYITNDTGDAGFTTSMIWQAGGQPYTVDGTTVSIDFTDEGSTKFAEMWQQLIDEDLLAPISSWSDEWYQGLGDGTIASLTIGAWMPGNLVTGVEAASGDFKVAQMPQWAAGESVTAENGGSSLTIPALSKNQELAYEFLEYVATGDGVQVRIDLGAFPATTADLESDEFLSKEFEYFGGQKVNEILSASAADVATGWSYLPFQVYANSIFNDNVGKAYVSDTTLVEGLAAWQAASITYGNDQGFTVD
jgi:multiple sugar transport system substrate-binding protein